MSTRVFCYDTEFIEDGHTIELISIGIVCDDRREYYAVNADMPVDRIVEHKWLRANVWPQLPIRWNDHPTVYLDTKSSLVRPKWVIANEVRDFITEVIPMGDTPQLWADYGAYDHVVLTQLFGPMINLPEGIPMFTHDLRQLRGQLSGAWKEPQQSSGTHNALEDARHNMRLYQAMTNELAGCTASFASFRGTEDKDDDLRFLRKFPDECCAEVTRSGESQPCGETATAVTLAVEDGHWWPVCQYHSRKRPLVSLADLITALERP